MNAIFLGEQIFGNAKFEPNKLGSNFKHIKGQI